MKGSVTKWECLQSRSPSVASMGEFRSLAARLPWDLNHCKATGEGLRRMCQRLKLDASQITGVNIPIMCLKASQSGQFVTKMPALPWKGVLTQSHIPLSSDSGSCSHSFCCHTSFSTAWQEQAKFPPPAQVWQILWYSTAQHSSSVRWLSLYRARWMLKMLSLNHSHSPAWPQTFSTSLYISLIFHFLVPYFIFLVCLESHHLVSFSVFQ